MSKFVHLHVHSQYSLLDGQASIPRIVDKAMSDGMPGIALTDHGVMYGIKEFTNYVADKNKPALKAVKELKKRIKAVESGADDPEGKTLDELQSALQDAQSKVFTPIIGCEMYVANGSNEERSDKHDTGRHLVVLAKNKIGYNNLIKLVSEAWTKGFYFHPRTDKESIAARHEGLIISSACLGGEIPRLLMRGDIEGADKAVKWWKDLMGDDYYLELQRHKATIPDANHETYEKQCEIEPEIIRLARKYDIKLIATNDSHFVNEEDAEAHDHLICISTKADLNDEDRMRYSKQEWLKTTEEMSQLFNDIPEAIENTNEILNKVEIYSIDHEPIMPNFAIPTEFGTEEEYRQRLTHEDLFNEFTRDQNGNVVLSQDEAEEKIEHLGGYEKLYRIKFEADYLRKLAYDGAAKRYETPLKDEIRERIDFELHIMKTMGFPGYFLIVQDFIRAGREELDVSIGPGRGSAAGSVVAYCLGITQIDPLKYDLLFERFLNPDRISLPDIDVDFDDDGRAKVLKYVTEKYGEPNVAHIITYGTMAAKSAIKDVARVEKLSIPESNRLTKLIPQHMPTKDGKELKPTLANCLKYVDAFKNELQGDNPTIKKTLKYAEQLEGNVRNTGVHACGVIICRDPVSDWVPIATADDKDEGKLLVTQYEGSVIEQTGLIKMDFLGLKTLSIIRTAIANIRNSVGVKVDIDNIPIDDKATYELFSQGRTIGTFQFESQGMQKYLRELQPSKFEDLIAMNALYRPGPMEYIPDFIARKHGRSPIEYDIPCMEQYLKDTYGITVYQEQVMLLSRQLADFTRGESDALRKAMGKKKKAIVDAMKPKFIEGGKKHGYDPKVLEKIWGDWEKFASYAFNKSHATCYSWIAYQTGYLKAHYPAQYMAAVLTHNRTDIAKLTGFMDECRAMGIVVKGPDVNESVRDFGVTSKGDIRFGLSAISGIGDSVVDEIVKARGDQPFANIYDFVERVPSSSINRRVFENLALAGAFDCFDIKREDLVNEGSNHPGESIPEILLRYGQHHQCAKNQSQASLFGDDDEQINNDSRPPIPSVTEWLPIVRLDKERDLIGMYLSAHPLDPYFLEVNYGVTCTLAELENLVPTDGMEVAYGGIVTSCTDRMTRKGKPMTIVKLEDFTSSSEFMIFEEQKKNFGHLLTVGKAVLIRGVYKSSYGGGELRFNITNVVPLEDLKGKMVNTITLNLRVEECNDDFLTPITTAITNKNRDKAQTLALKFNVYEPEINRSVLLNSSSYIKVNRQLIDELKEIGISFKIEQLN